MHVLSLLPLLTLTLAFPTPSPNPNLHALAKRGCMMKWLNGGRWVRLNASDVPWVEENWIARKFVCYYDDGTVKSEDVVVDDDGSHGNGVAADPSASPAANASP